jgi:UDP-N-acetylglucosamine 2-epimerase (non-hydrolysing)
MFEHNKMNIKRKILIVFGTRPEAIKLCPLIKEFEKHEDTFETRVCVTAQHREMLDQVLGLFLISPNYDLDIMKPDQDLFEVTSGVLKGMKDILDDFVPDFVIVQGDTTTAFITALAAYYQKIPIGHVEAGLRTGNIYSPWPEEVNRCLVGQIAKIHFAPTESSRQNLLGENKNKEDIFVTGNTVIDALFWMLDRIKTDKRLREKITIRLRNLFSGSSFDLDKVKLSQRRMVLITGHRRENFGSGFLNICQALKNLAIENKTIDFVYPVHLNPSVQKPVYELLSEINNIHLIEPLEYETFVYLMDLSSIILTDSGGVQEEAPSLGKPVLVMRNTTERPEAVDGGTVKLVGTDDRKIFDETMNLLHNQQEYQKMAKAHNPYGDGKASRKIVRIISEYFGDRNEKC